MKRHSSDRVGGAYDWALVEREMPCPSSSRRMNALRW